jgi:predicted transcriptional regulator
MRIDSEAEGDMAKKKAGRKVKTEERIDIRLRVDADFQRRVQEAADRQGNPVAAFIRAAVAKELDRLDKESAE